MGILHLLAALFYTSGVVYHIAALWALLSRQRDKQ